MTSTKKRFATIMFVAIYALSLFTGVTRFVTGGNSGAYAQGEDAHYGYYYDNLTVTDSRGDATEYTLAKRFYKALEEINASGAFKKGTVEYALDSILTSDEIQAWVIQGRLDIPKAFGAARDSFIVDHPELFYVDMYKLTISAARTNGVYSAYIDCGREADCYRDPAVNTEALVNAEIAKFDAAVNSIAQKATAKADAQTDVERDYALAVAVNEEIASSVEYDFDEYNHYIENEGEVSATPMTYSAYGALVNKKSVCSGFAQAYKAVMDKLDAAPCIVVSGFCKGQTKDGEDTEFNVGHAWNYVYLRTGTKTEAQSVSVSAQGDAATGAWFAFDTTWNSLNKNINKYSAMNAVTAAQKHIPDGIISSSNYRLTYPGLCPVYYEQALDPSNFDFTVEDEGFVYKATYADDMLTETLSYNGKNLRDVPDGCRVVFRWYHKNVNGDNKEQWTKWMDFAQYEKYVSINLDAIAHESDRTIIYGMGMSDRRLTQYGIVKDLVGDEDVVVSPSLKFEGLYYTDDQAVEDHAVFLSQKYENTAYGSYTPAPYLSPTKTKPYYGADVIIEDYMRDGDSNLMADKHAILISLVYNEPLHVLDESKPIVPNFTPTSYNTKQYADFAKFPDGEYVHIVADGNGVKNTIQFRFKPSLMYEHNREGYLFTFENVGSAKIIDRLNDEGKLEMVTSDKAPNYAFYMFSRMSMACPKVFGDGRLWIECCAQPTLVDNSDLSAMNFRDEEGNSTFTESARSQMMLVVNNVSKQTENEMLDEISGADGIDVDKSEIQASQTYDIKLQICGKYSKISDGSYVKIGLGFPQGYGPDDEGVTFKIFHRKHIGGDEYVIEEVPCVVTKFGIVATVTSFSPYMVAVVPQDKASGKTIYASVNGKGGRLTNEDGKIQTIAENGSYTYTIAPDAGYQLYKVTLNGENVTDRVADNKLTVSYAELSLNNELEIEYISDVAAQRYEEKNIVDPVKIFVTADDFKAPEAVDPAPADGGANIGLIVGLIAGAVVIAAAAAAVVIILKKKKGPSNK